MDKKKVSISGIAWVLLFTGIALPTLSASPDVIIYAFDQNPAGRDEGNEWVTLHNHSNVSVDIGKWALETPDGERETIAEGTALSPFAYYVYSTPYQWLNGENESITLSDAKGEEIDSTPVVSDSENDNRYWMRNNSEWIFDVKEFEKGKIWKGIVKHVVDGDTIDVSFDIHGIQRIRLVGVNTPEIGEEGYEAAKEFVNVSCLGEVVKLDVDDREQYDRYYRILAVVYVNDTNLNEKLVRDGHAEIMYIPPSEFNPREWVADYTASSSPTVSLTSTPMPSPSPSQTSSPTPQIPCFEFVFAIIGVVAAICLILFRLRAGWDHCKKDY